MFGGLNNWRVMRNCKAVIGQMTCWQVLFWQLQMDSYYLAQDPWEFLRQLAAAEHVRAWECDCDRDLDWILSVSIDKRWTCTSNGSSI